MAFDACEKFVGPMPVESFLSEFVPEASKIRPAAAITFAHKTVSQNENEFIQLIEDAGICPNLKFINTTHCISANLKPDIAIYSGTDRDDPGTQSGSQRSLNWTAVDLWIENKNEKDDVFRDLEEMGREARAKSDLKSHIRWTKGAYRVSGQLIAYTSAIHRSQFRVFSFSVVLFGNTGRLLRWDRSGVIYTEPFNWSTQPDTLFEFLWRLNFLSDVKRGYDTTVTSVADDEAEAALSKLRTYEGLENVAKADLHKFLVRDDHTLNGQIKYFIAPSAVWDSEALFGRSTFGYIAYDPETTNLVYLKDFWRTERDGIQKEGDVYRELHDAQVPNIAKLGLAGDVPLLPECGRTDSPAVQRTMTQEFVKDWCPGQPRVDPYVHYRLVLETLGEPLHRFKSTRELCKVIRDAIAAHTEAYERVGILHRDVSAGNILITEKRSGILIDWDLSKKVVKEGSGKKRQHSRTGTWQFISIARLQEPSTRPHEVSDDLESFFWVLLYLVAKCRGPENVSNQLQNVFDQNDDMDDDGIIRGGRGKLYCLRQAALDPMTIEDLVKTPCKNIIEELRSLFNNLYRHVQPLADITPSTQLSIKAKRDRDESVQDAVKKLRSSEEVLSIINEHLKSRWDVDNDGSLYKVKFRPDPATSRNRRKRKAEDDGGKDLNERRRGRFPPSSTRPSQSRDMLGLQRHRSSFGSGSSRTRPSENQ
ncbi:hypothetical protein EDB92DRAFT_1459802 [Lactarius akahatsu]|uniref:Protein kinase domain-containing protein n=1 Tax=Lactarius akahatsu TaxID=416441 RepID=A0AAD4QAA3_9AGAM|nr:hypothetical protein EDB92DRAFT_1459802 [Lactarius akahatsu]